MSFPPKNSLPHWLRLGRTLSYTAIIGLGASNVAWSQVNPLKVIRAVMPQKAVAKAVAQAEAKPAEGEEPKDGKKQGPFEDFAPALKDCVKISLEGGKIVSSCDKSFQEVSQTLHQVAGALGHGGTSSSWGQVFNFRFDWQRLNGTVVIGNANSSFEVNATEREVPYREVKLKIDKSGSMNLVVASPAIGYYLRIDQKEDGRFRAVELNLTEKSSAASANFLEFCKSHKDFASGRVVPLMRSFGIEVPAMPYDASVAKEALARLTQVDESLIREFDSLVSELDSDDFETREKASERVTSEFAKYAQLFPRAVDDEQFSLETRSRLRKIFQEKSEAVAVRANDLISSATLMNDPTYLYWLEGEAKSDVEKNAVHARLVAVVGEDKGNPEAWAEFFANQAKGPESPSDEPTAPAVDTPIFTEGGGLTFLREDIQSLIGLGINSQGLSINREHWKAAFGGKSFADLNKEILDEIDKRKMPKNFWQGEQLSWLGEDAAAVILVLKMQEHLQKRNVNGVAQTIHYASTQANPSLSAGGMSVSLQTREDNQQRGVRWMNVDGRMVAQPPENQESQPFSFSATELGESKQQVRVGQSKNGDFFFGFSSNDGEKLLQLGKFKDGWLLQEINGTEVNSFKAESYQALAEQNKDYFEKKFFPLLSSLGIEIKEIPEPAPPKPAEGNVPKEVPPPAELQPEAKVKQDAAAK